MRRIYESQALRRDDDHFTPSERSDGERPQAMRSVPGAALSRLFVPHWLRYRALSVAIETQRAVFEAGEPIPFRVTLRNTVPIPITVVTDSPLLWTWTVDGVPEASHVDRELPDERGSFTFGRGERKRFVRRWPQSFRVSDDEWEPVEPGEYTLGASMRVPDAAAKGLTDETTVRVE